MRRPPNTCKNCLFYHVRADSEPCRRCSGPADGCFWTPNVAAPTVAPTAKHDQGKARWDLLPWPVLEGVVTILTTGAPGHGERGWRTLPGARDRYFSAMMRHAMAWLKGETRDAESGLHPLVHVAANALILADLAGVGRPVRDDSADVSTVGAARDGGS